MDDLAAMTVDAIVAESQELGRQIDALREQRRLLADELRRRMPPGVTPALTEAEPPQAG